MTASAAAPLLSVRDLRIVFDGRHGPLTALDGVSFDIAPGKSSAWSANPGPASP